MNRKHLYGLALWAALILLAAVLKGVVAAAWVFFGPVAFVLLLLALGALFEWADGNPDGCGCIIIIVVICIAGAIFG